MKHLAPAAARPITILVTIDRDAYDLLNAARFRKGHPTLTRFCGQLLEGFAEALDPAELADAIATLDADGPLTVPALRLAHIAAPSGEDQA